MSISLARRTAPILATLVLCVAGSPNPASAAAGGIGTEDPKPASHAKPGKAKLLPNGKAVPPSNAPPRIVAVIEAANKIRKKPYVYGGGHGSWNDRGYDCSGAVSFALHGGQLLSSPLPSGSLMSWGQRGRGRWITVYANGGHTFARIAGLRWDTSGTGGNGPRWQRDPGSGAGFVKRHPRGF